LDAAARPSSEKNPLGWRGSIPEVMFGIGPARTLGGNYTENAIL